MLSAISEPPKPRLITVSSGKSFASVVHSRMLELPTTSTAWAGGGIFLSAASNAAISGSKGARDGGAPPLAGPGPAAAVRRHRPRQHSVMYMAARVLVS